MITIAIDEINETQSFEFVVKGQRRITLSINAKNLSLTIPGGVKPLSISNMPDSFFLRTNDVDSL